MHGIDVEQRVEPVLIEQHEAHQHQTAGEQMGDVEVEGAHQKPFDTNRRRVPSKPSISAAPRNSGTRNTRILAIEVSKTASSAPPTASLTRYEPQTDQRRRTIPAPLGANPQGTNRQAISEI